MDYGVALVEAYLKLNGYFTVTEYPILFTDRRGEVRTVTDIDILAVRFAGASRGNAAVKRGRFSGPISPEIDAALRAPTTGVDMIVGEVKEGKTRFNPAIHDVQVLSTTLARFGCCSPEEAPKATEQLLTRGIAETGHGHRIRLVAFGSTDGSEAVSRAPGQFITYRQMLSFLDRCFEENWELLRHAQMKEPALGFLSLIKKSERILSRLEVKAPRRLPGNRR